MSDNTNDGAHERRSTGFDPAERATVSAPLSPPAGWYPDPHDAATQRYWDGAQWTDHRADAAGAVLPVTSAVPQGAVDGSADAAAVAASTKRGLPTLKWWQWALIAFAALVLVSIIVNAVNGGRASSENAAEPASVVERDAAPTVEEEPVEMVEVPDLVGSTIAEARVALDAVGLVLVPSEAGDDWVITAQQPAKGSHPVEGLELSVTSEAPKPLYTLAQQNAIGTARDYLDYSGFSRSGLIGQLEYEGFSTEEATFGADNAGADWNAEAAETAQDYMDYSSFSRQGLYDQLAYEGFSDAEIQFGLAAIGY